MRFFTATNEHRFYCGVDLHARTMYLCILDAQGQVAFDKNLPADGPTFLKAIAPFRDRLVVAVECLFCWYWLADLCAAERIAFVLGHALYMKAIHAGKAKNDQIDAGKIARLLRGGALPLAYVYPAGMRETRDLLRRRQYLVHKRVEAITHIHPSISPEGRRDVDIGLKQEKATDALTTNMPARRGDLRAELGQPLHARGGRT